MGPLGRTSLCTYGLTDDDLTEGQLSMSFHFPNGRVICVPEEVIFNYEVGSNG